MAYTIGKILTAYPPRPSATPGGGPFFSTGAGANSPKVGAVFTAATGGDWCGAAPTYAYTWYLTGSMAHASATNASYSISANAGGIYMSCKVLAGNAVWGTNTYVVATGTCIP